MRPKPETLQRKAAERKAAKHSARGVRGAARQPAAAGGGGGKGGSSSSRKASGKKRSFAKFK